jgi:NlpC/P60 family
VIPRIASVIPVCLLLVESHALAQDVVDVAARLIGHRYEWGAEGPEAFDCSGLTQFVYQEFGVDLPRRAISQSKIGDPAGRRLQRGDLLFFATDSRRSLVTHVGLYEGSGLMIDASKRHGRVQRDDLADPFWVERFMFARRVTGSFAGAERPARRNDPTVELPRPSSTHGRAAVRVLERVADILLRRPGR